MSKRPKLGYWVGVFLLAGYAIWRLVTTLIDDPGGDYTGWVIGLVGTAAIVAFVDWRNTARTRRLRESHPDAFVSNIIAYRQLVGQSQSVAELFGGRTTLRRASYATLVIDDEAVRVFRGGLRPQEVFSVPSASLTGAQIVSKTMAAWNVPCIELTFGRAEKTAEMDFCLMRTRLGVPRNVPRAPLELHLAAVMKFVQSRERTPDIRNES
jgi:hypothetical protein